MAKRLIEVTQEMVKKDCHSAYSCPIHEAITVHLKSNVVVGVSTYSICYYNDQIKSPTIIDTTTPDEIVEWVRDYDMRIANLQVPFTFELEIPDEVLK